MLAEIIQRHLDEINIFGLASLEGLLEGEYSGYKSGIALLERLDDRIIDSISSGPNQEYLNLYHKTNRNLDRKAKAIAEDLCREGFHALALSPTKTIAQLDGEDSGLRAPVSHKMTATRAGLGWIGKTDLFISEKWGPRVRLCTILLEETPESCGTPIEESRCGGCRICVEACPAGAATGQLWNTGLQREDFYDPFKCREMCGILSNKNGIVDAGICGICISVCPRGKKN